MRLLWIYIFTLAFILALVFQDVSGDEHHKKGSKHKGTMNNKDGDGMHSHHPDVGRDNSLPGSPGDMKRPVGDRSPSHNRQRDHSGSSGHSSSSGHHKDKSSRRGQKHKDRKHGKDKHHGDKKKHRNGKHHPK